MSTTYQNWLNQVTLPYTYQSHVAAEVDFTLRTFHGLRPQSSLYTLSDGTQCNLLNLVGTIPVISQQNGGRIIEVPLEICLPLQYPTEIPSIWVRPSLLSPEQRALMGNLVVRETECVDGNGVVWGLEVVRNSSLVEVVSHLQNVFKFQLPIVSSVTLNSLNSTNQNINNVSGNFNNTRSSIDRPVSPKNYNTQNSRSVRNTSSNNMTPITQNKSSNRRDDPREALKRKVADAIDGEMEKCNKEMENVCKTISSLEEGETILNRERMTLNNEINLLNKEINNLNTKRYEMERLLSTKMESNAVVTELRSATIPADPISSQLLELISNEAALMDVLYQIIKVTITPSGSEKLNLTMTLRCIRELSRKQFLTKVHIRKIINNFS